MSTYRERREARAERLEEWAEKREARATAEYDRAQQLGDLIPFGQPILVGHHSERGDRAYRDRIGRTYERAFENAAKAQSMSARAAGIKAQLDSSIYSDDHDAAEKLRERIAGLEAERDRIKAYNATCRKGSPDPSVLDDKQRRDLASALRFAAYQCKGGSFPAYHLSNLAGRIKKDRDRLVRLEAATHACDLDACHVCTGCAHGRYADCRLSVKCPTTGRTNACRYAAQS